MGKVVNVSLKFLKILLFIWPKSDFKVVLSHLSLRISDLKGTDKSFHSSSVFGHEDPCKTPDSHGPDVAAAAAVAAAASSSSSSFLFPFLFFLFLLLLSSSPQDVFIGVVPTHLESGAFQCCFPLKEHPSVSLAFPPVG